MLDELYYTTMVLAQDLENDRKLAFGDTQKRETCSICTTV